MVIASRRTHAQTAVSYTPHAARVSVYLVPYIACRDTVESEAGGRMRRRPFPTLPHPGRGLVERSNRNQC